MNICFPDFNVRDLNSCIRRGLQDSRMTCYPCCQDPRTSIQHCDTIRNGSEDARWTFDLAAVPALNPCEVEYSDQECVQQHYKTTGPMINTVRNIQTWQECQTKCRERMGCEWFSYIALSRKCILRRPANRSRRNTRRVTGSKRRENFYSGSIMSSDTSSANCHCPSNNRYGTPRTTEQSSEWGQSNWGNNNRYSNPTTTERSSAWGWGSWGDPCPTGNKQTQDIMGYGVIQCCPLEEGTDGTPICQY